MLFRSGVNGILRTYLICDGIKKQVVPISYLSIKQGTQKNMNIEFPLIDSMIGDQKGNCFVQVNFSNSLANTQSFKLSNKINLNVSLNEDRVSPQEQIILDGVAIKEDKEPVNGFITLSIKDTEINLTQVVNNGRFKFKFSFPRETESKEYLLNFFTYEKDQENKITNQGTSSKKIFVKQIPNNLEIIINNKNIEPGEDLEIKTILHDQTGENIKTKTELKIFNDEKTLAEKTVDTGTPFKISLATNESFGNYTISAVSKNIKNKIKFNIEKKESIKIKLINRTIIIKNTGNIPYNKTLKIKIGNSTSDLKINLKLNEVKRYVLSAPDGEYSIEILSDGKTELKKHTFLTGNTVNIKESQNKIFGFFNSPFVWIFTIIIFGLIAFILIKKEIGRAHV